MKTINKAKTPDKEPGYVGVYNGVLHFEDIPEDQIRAELEDL